MNLIYLVIAGSFFFTLLFVWSKRFHNFSPDEQPIIGLTVTFSSILFALLLSFTVANLYNNFQELRAAITKEVVQLELMYELVKDSPAGQPIITAIKAYVDSVVADEWNSHQQGELSPKTEKLAKQLNQEIIKYTRANPDDPINGQLLSMLEVDERGTRLEANKDHNFMIIIIILTGLLTVIGFWFLNTSSFIVQFVVDFGVITIIALSIYLLLNLNKPLQSDELGLSMKEFQDLQIKLGNM